MNECHVILYMLDDVDARDKIRGLGGYLRKRANDNVWPRQPLIQVLTKDFGRRLSELLEAAAKAAPDVDDGVPRNLGGGKSIPSDLSNSATGLH